MTNIWADPFSDIRELSLQEKEEKKEKKETKNKGEDDDDDEDESSEKRWWDDDGDGKGYEEGEVKGSFKKKIKKEEFVGEAKKKPMIKVSVPKEKLGYTVADIGPGGKEYNVKSYGSMNKEERDLYSKNSKNEKLDVKSGIKNKINTKPTVTEELEAWIDELISEGYDLSMFSLDEVIDIYESVDINEEDTYGMPPKGDAEREKPDPLAAAKAKAAKAKVSKERADFQIAQQAQRMKVSTTEAVVSYVSGRTPFYEGVFDPKKTKLRPASERTKNPITDADRRKAKKEDERVATIHSKGETALTGMRSSGSVGKVKTTPTPKSKPPEANRTVKGKEDKLAAAAEKILKDIKK